MTLTVFHTEFGNKPLGINFNIFIYGSFIKSVQKRMAGNIGGIAGARKSAAAERALSDGAVGKCAEGTAPMFHLINNFRGFLAHDFDGILITHIITAFYSVE